MDESVPLYLRRYPGHDTLKGAEEWDRVTREVVLSRVRAPPPIRFFSPQESRALIALADTVIPQDDRPEHLRVPLVNFLDERLYRNEGRGYRYEDTPPDPELWRLVAAALDDEAQLHHGRDFAHLPPTERDHLFAEVADDDQKRSILWSRMGRWDIVLPYLLLEFASHYYGHPYGWNEIGFPGPRFPRIYARTVLDNPDEPKEAPHARRA